MNAHGFSDTLYAELQALATREMQNERSSHTLDPTALVHEAYVRLQRDRAADPEQRSQFLGLAARMMRRILVDHAKGRNRLKRGGGNRRRVSVHDEHRLTEGDAVDVLVVSDAIEVLSANSDVAAQIVELQVFGGMSREEIAVHLELSEGDVKRKLEFAYAWLRRRFAEAWSSS